jgi:hypothetical protein
VPQTNNSPCLVIAAECVEAEIFLTRLESKKLIFIAEGATLFL